MNVLLHRLISHEPAWRMIQRAVVTPAAKFVHARQEVLAERLHARLGQDAIVRSGPFQGMRYPVLEAAGSAILPKLLGTYEAELAEVVARIGRLRPRVIVDVGCAEGYYAVGFARLLPDAQVYAYDIDPRARELCQAMARANGVDARVSVRGACDAAALAELALGPGALLIADCEGYEQQLFDDATAARLTGVHLLIELHDFMDRSITPTLTRRFEPTHALEFVYSLDDAQKVRQYASADVSAQDPLERAIAFAENRPEIMRWLFATPRQPSAMAGADQSARQVSARR